MFPSASSLISAFSYLWFILLLIKVREGERERERKRETGKEERETERIGLLRQAVMHVWIFPSAKVAQAPRPLLLEC